MTKYWGIKSQRKGKFKKREKITTSPVETPYVPPKLKRVAKSLLDKTIEIFEGMTTIEIVETLCRIDSEYDPLSIDPAELVAMVSLTA